MSQYQHLQYDGLITHLKQCVFGYYYKLNALSKGESNGNVHIYVCFEKGYVFFQMKGYYIIIRIVLGEGISN